MLKPKFIVFLEVTNYFLHPIGPVKYEDQRGYARREQDNMNPIARSNSCSIITPNTPSCA